MMIIRVLAVVVVAGLAAVACSPVSLLNASIPRSGYTLHKDVAYGVDPRQKLDIYVPDGASPAHKLPVVVFFYGGSWQWGSKKDYRFLGQALASKGIISVVADYRLYPQIYYPDFVKDGAQAFRFAHDHIGDYNGDAQAMFIAGHSAGAYIAMMLTLNKSFFAEAGVQEAWVKGTIGISGPYDFLPFTDNKIKALFSKVSDKNTQPITFVTKHNPPIFMATGDDDDTVLPRNTFNLRDMLLAAHTDNDVEVKIYPGIGHIGIMLSLARGFRGKSPLLDDMAAFVNSRLIVNNGGQLLR